MTRSNSFRERCCMFDVAGFANLPLARRLPVVPQLFDSRLGWAVILLPVNQLHLPNQLTTLDHNDNSNVVLSYLSSPKHGWTNFGFEMCSLYQ